MTDAQTIKLTPWHGGKCPVESRSLVTVEWRNGEVRSAKASDFTGWWHSNAVADIVGYALIRTEIETPPVDRSARGWVLWTRTQDDDMRFVMWADYDGIRESPDSLHPMFDWDEFIGRGELLAPLTPADLEANHE